MGAQLRPTPKTPRTSRLYGTEGLTEVPEISLQYTERRKLLGQLLYFFPVITPTALPRCFHWKRKDSWLESFFFKFMQPNLCKVRILCIGVNIKIYNLNIYITCYIHIQKYRYITCCYILCIDLYWCSNVTQYRSSKFHIVTIAFL